MLVLLILFPLRVKGARYAACKQLQAGPSTPPPTVVFEQYALNLYALTRTVVPLCIRIYTIMIHALNGRAKSALDADRAPNTNFGSTVKGEVLDTL
ncbi:hypothetical protein B9Q03_05455 [Candidatus Marsarchaeota G2 archaeon OSP_D]|uniref:Uncharacterized protein n=5 Tax=Candidatus Marsarchaeota group 2 TaxID=2203771 RepID=A0A2R6CAK9_9ARCH|nr:MAG: hypothetical protein B9Q03_05455 [Candidatus Marsarchaeota G2 archaeon OSP_D]PSN96103.1 MAG: hypothetical protein B9Q06_03235 [Candidatus Marsarchaeota G2 archaeon ECH_B_2]PSO00202.1 MAG: hypothetical protein B9Q07_04575 [Candidatus Marsarchaeota G2 archaeon ECH_B_3]PSO02697.1 MAG: hypothetical protein B9Q05_04105 [Candidatus Marsarchaeota G2 archaeon ECH_B_1]PSO07939.1 MAG: hypothetical protein B9Q04_08185 [Candidatus Marsarchaeota G2 archaeon BE_D]